ncbi:MAG: single-stranded DNA-binding protein [Bacilli bacterium]|nr:single-stranded DNA-binding protein [Bacilli bacterium]
MNNVVLIGRLTRDPELRYLPNTGTANCTFNIAVDRGLSKEKKQEMESKNQPTADFIRIVTWNKIAENCANYLTKGRMVGVQGRIQTGFYEKDGQKIYTTDVVASQIEFLGGGTEQSGKNAHTENSFDNELAGFMPFDSDDIPF